MRYSPPRLRSLNPTANLSCLSGSAASGGTFGQCVDGTGVSLSTCAEGGTATPACALGWEAGPDGCANGPIAIGGCAPFGSRADTGAETCVGGGGGVTEGGQNCRAGGSD